MDSTVLTAGQDGWVEITLNRPERLNAFDDRMHRELRATLGAAQGARAVLLTGAGRGFCAGQDLSDRNPDAGGPPDLGATLAENYNPLIRAIRGFPVPVVCAVNGVAAGAGANIALACDIVLAARSARFIQSFARVGLVPDAGGSWLLPRLLGEARAKALAMTAEPLDADTAAHWGLIWRAVPDDALMAEARALAGRLAAGATAGLAAAKALIQDAAARGLDAQLDAEAQVQKERGESADYAEGVRAFLQKRDPDFRGLA